MEKISTPTQATASPILDERLQVFLHAFLFVLGFSLVFVTGWGGSVTALGQLFVAYKRVIAQIGGVVFYRRNESPGHGYGPGDIFWADGTRLKILTGEDVAQISLNLDPREKTIRVEEPRTMAKPVSNPIFIKKQGGRNATR